MTDEGADEENGERADGWDFDAMDDANEEFEQGFGDWMDTVDVDPQEYRQMVKFLKNSYAQFDNVDISDDQIEGMVRFAVTATHLGPMGLTAEEVADELDPRFTAIEESLDTYAEQLEDAGEQVNTVREAVDGLTEGVGALQETVEDYECDTADLDGVEDRLDSLQETVEALDDAAGGNLPDAVAERLEEIASDLEERIDALDDAGDGLDEDDLAALVNAVDERSGDLTAVYDMLEQQFEYAVDAITQAYQQQQEANITPEQAAFFADELHRAYAHGNEQVQDVWEQVYGKQNVEHRADLVFGSGDADDVPSESDLHRFYGALRATPGDFTGDLPAYEDISDNLGSDDEYGWDDLFLVGDLTRDEYNALRHGDVDVDAATKEDIGDTFLEEGAYDKKNVAYGRAQNTLQAIDRLDRLADL